MQALSTPTFLVEIVKAKGLVAAARSGTGVAQRRAIAVGDGGGVDWQKKPDAIPPVP